MKTTVLITMALTLLGLTSCQPDQKTTQKQPVPQQPSAASRPQADAPGSHTVVTQEVIQGNSYSYVNVEENDETFWIAIKKTELTPGEIFSFSNPMKMPNFRSKELQRTFDVIYFVGAIDKDGSPTNAQPSLGSGQKIPIGHPSIDSEQKKPAGHPAAISVEPVAGGVSIGELFADKASYAGKTIQIRGQVTKINLAIMGMNWIHLQDGTGGAGTNDLLVTTGAKADVGDTVTLEGIIVLDKDFGSGYKYKLLMENAKLIE